MAIREFRINGETLVQVKGNTNSAIGNVTELGLASEPIKIQLHTYHDDVTLDAWGGRAAADTQIMLAEAYIYMSLIHFDMEVLQQCMVESLGMDSSVSTNRGKLRQPGTFLGQDAGGYIRLNLTSPVENLPWRFFNTYIMDSPPLEISLGTKAMVVPLCWKAIPYVTSLWNSSGVVASVDTITASGQVTPNLNLYDHTLDV